MYMRIFIRGIYGHIVPFTLDGSDSIANLKEYIQDLCGYPQDRQTLVFAGKVLHDDCRSVADYRIQEDSSVFILLAPGPQPFLKTSMYLQQKTSVKSSSRLLCPVPIKRSRSPSV